MKLTPSQIEGMMRLIGLTRPKEIDCDSCAAQLAEFAETKLLGRQIPEALGLVEHHLSICPDCHEEYRALSASLTALGLDPEPPGRAESGS
jgi:hypothetical protein